MPQIRNTDVHLTSTMAAVEAIPRDETTPMRVAVLGNFSGRHSSPSDPPLAPLADRRPILVDRDNLDEVLSRLGVTLTLLPSGNTGEPLTLRFGELDDFHPDRLVRNMPAFEALRELRADLRNPAKFAKAAARMRGWSVRRTPEAPVTPQEQPSPDRALSRAQQADLLDELLAETQARPQPTQRLPGGQDWQAFLQKVVEPHLLPRVDYAEQAELEAVVNQAAAAQLRTVLHHPDMQGIEAAWRSLHFLTRRLDTDSNLKLYLVDVTKAELAADLASSDDPRATEIGRVLFDQTAASRPWGILAGLYRFDQSQDDVDLLERLGRLAQQAGAPFLAEGSCRLLGRASLATMGAAGVADPQAEQRWNALRQRPETSYLCLALPRFLLRLPYGRDTSPVEEFDFEELPEGADHEGHLWGNPAVACAYLLAESFRRRGWDFDAGNVREIADLPLHVYYKDGQSCIQPCAEVLLDEETLKAILKKGLMPLLSMRDQDRVCVGRFRSLGETASFPAGRWC